MRGCADETTYSVAGCATKSSEQPLHRLGVLIELDDVIDDRPDLVDA